MFNDILFLSWAFLVGCKESKASCNRHFLLDWNIYTSTQVIWSFGHSWGSLEDGQEISGVDL